MPALVYRITEVLSSLVLELPIGTNLALFHLLWALISGRLLANRGALIPALAAIGLDPTAVRRAWAAFAHGAWDVSTLVTALHTLVLREGRWHPRRQGGYRAVAVDTVGFFRPRLKDCATRHYLSQAGTALPAIPFGLIAAVGSVGSQTVPVLRRLVRAPSTDATEAEVVTAVLTHVARLLAPDEAAVTDRGCALSKIQAAGVPRFVTRVAKNFTARRATPPAYSGRGRRPTRGELVRPLARQRGGKCLAATPPDRTESFHVAGRLVRAAIWEGLCLPHAVTPAAQFQCVVLDDPAFKEPLVLVTNLPLTAAELLAFYHERWPIEQIPLAAKQLIGAHHQFVFADSSRQRLPELALLAGGLLMYLAATQPAHPTGFWDRAPRPTAGRLRRVLTRLNISETWPLPKQLRKKESVTDHLPKGISAHRRSAQPIPARV
ncbi:MAG: hypothetical protein ACREJC_05165 [Tepidisphaeraceae bacterium]